MDHTNDKQLVVVADSEQFFVPHLIAKLAKAGIVQAIIIREPPFSFERVKRKVLRQVEGFGIWTMFLSALCSLAAIIANTICPNRFFSLNKVARRFGIPCHHIEKINDLQFDEILDAYTSKTVFFEAGVKLKPSTLKKATFINRHCGALPSYAGVNPVFWAMLNGDQTQAVTLHIIDEEYDAGPIISQATIPTGKHSFFSAYHALFDETADLMIDLVKEGLQKNPNSQETRQRTYYSWQGASERRRFIKQGSRFGIPFRLHPSIEV